jgi:1-acyl-sn-glycerol-3-phosphate acyltransferase
MMVFRNLLFYLGLIPLTFVCTLLGWLCFFMPFKVRYWIITRWSHFFIFWAKLTCGLNYRVEGLEHLPKQTAIVFSNHQSAWETIFFQTLLPTQTWILKKELLYIPVFGWGLKLIEPIAIKRKGGDAKTKLLREGLAKLKQNRWVIVFPEGTRVAVGEDKRFAKGGAALAEASGYPIVPIRHNAGTFWPKGFFIKRPGVIQVKIGPTIYPQGKSIHELNVEAERWIKSQS